MPRHRLPAACSAVLGGRQRRWGCERCSKRLAFEWTCPFNDYKSSEHDPPAQRALVEQRRKSFPPRPYASKRGPSLAHDRSSESDPMHQNQKRRQDQKGGSDKCSFPGPARLAIPTQQVCRVGRFYFWANEHASQPTAAAAVAAVAAAGACGADSVPNLGCTQPGL